MKKIILILTVTLLFSLIYSTASADSLLYKGDINIDGNINAADALLVLRHAAKIELIDTLVADVDENKSVNANDALLILKYAAKMITEFPGGNLVKSETTDNTPVPSETVSPLPTETTGPNPTETVTPVPSETVKPTETPELTPIERIKDYIEINGFDGTDGEKIYGYSYEDNTVKASIVYTSENILIFALDYEEVIDSETMLVSLEMKYNDGFDNITLEAGYENEDFKQNYKAKATIVPEEITSETTYSFTETSSVNCSESEKEAILSMGDMYTEMALYLWNSILSDDMGLSLKDIGFTNYNP